jgi:hypothetical protein
MKHHFASPSGRKQHRKAAKKVVEEDDENVDNYHFISYIGIRGVAYELDGLQPAPVPLGTYTDQASWWTAARPAIQERMERYVISKHSMRYFIVTKWIHMGNHFLSGCTLGIIICCSYFILRVLFFLYQ